LRAPSIWKVFARALQGMETPPEGLICQNGTFIRVSARCKFGMLVIMQAAGVAIATKLD
jgi:hypothetical protein